MDDRVTAIREEHGGLRVTVNETEAFRLSKTDARELPLEMGQALDWEQYKHDLLLRHYPAALDRAVKLLAVRARSRAEMERRLTEAGYLSEAVEMAVYKLETESLLDDEAFARAWVRARAASRYGRARILMELRYKGVAEETAQAALSELAQVQQDDRTAELAAKFLRRYAGETPADARRKTIAALQRRGYAYGEALRAYETANTETEE